MLIQTHRFQQQATQYFLGESLLQLGNHVDRNRAVLVIDENVERHHGHHLHDWKKIIVPAGEEVKNMATIENIIDGLTAHEADRKTTLVGIGGGMLTDVAGFAAAIYMRGIPFGFVPTTLLAQVDASIGGKNGVSHGKHKNLLGIIRQPSFILFDYTLPLTMPDEEWHNGFAEIIKYACIMDAALFDFLEANKEKALLRDVAVLEYLVEKSVAAKTKVVLEDEFENGPRRWLNFGHTLGHAVEKLEHMAHGKAVAIGMVAASRFSEKLIGFPAEQTQRLIRLISNYQLPVAFTSDKTAVFDIFKLDKKREKDVIHFVLLEEIGKATTMAVPITELRELLQEL
ncbi:3-dehydroquinate synthase [Chitinophaga nivalis]|uniref:3-dehydroquinate synthase n=1 Tax=Chitinophaga nivalis TaxID=2991709 RepID=A0ABT3IFW0_9BACT|nr:3-dehydroquinate synthase [Chitinophaga nivalis]MCW3467461.1 3-dehydroquinate synthase [Chitinophaga nivalis]MCW3482847.1 3-dehydroquinate synthase [Chitinophaga nivalis]